MNPPAYELCDLAPQSPRDSKGMSLGYTSFKDEERVEQESSLSHEDHIIPKVSAPLHTKCKSTRLGTRESSKPVLNTQPDLNHCCSL